MLRRGYQGAKAAGVSLTDGALDPGEFTPLVWFFYAFSAFTFSFLKMCVCLLRLSLICLYLCLSVWFSHKRF